MKTLLRGLARWLGRLLVALILVVAGYVAYGSYAWRDIPAATLEQRYGDAELQTASVDGVNIRYRLHVASVAQAPVLVLIHSHFFEMGMWDAWVEQLAPEFTILRYDLSGHGLTGPDPTAKYNVERDVDLLTGLLSELNITQAVVVGSSLGGNIAFHFAAQHPEQTAGLVLVNSGGLKRKDRKQRGTIPAWADSIFPLVPPTALHRFVQWMAANDSVITDALLTRFVDMWRREGNRAAELSRLRQFDSGDPAQTLAQVTAPTLILWGEDNPQLAPELANQFTALLGSAASVETHIYPGIGHLIPLEAPLRSARDTAAFAYAVSQSQPPPQPLADPLQ